jgi:hypothetical protein
MMAAINLLYGLPPGDHNVPLIWCFLRELKSLRERDDAGTADSRWPAVT